MSIRSHLVKSETSCLTACLSASAPASRSLARESQGSAVEESLGSERISAR